MGQTLGQRASSSSKKMTHGLEARARENTCLTRDSDSPTNMFSSSGPFTLTCGHLSASCMYFTYLMKFAPLSLATAFARRVFPHLGRVYDSPSEIYRSKLTLEGRRKGSRLAHLARELESARDGRSAQASCSRDLLGPINEASLTT